LGGSIQLDAGSTMVLRFLWIKRAGSDKNRDGAGYRMLFSEFFGGLVAEFGHGLDCQHEDQ
jgi:hypothetical protein